MTNPVYIRKDQTFALYKGDVVLKLARYRADQRLIKVVRAWHDSHVLGSSVPAINNAIAAHDKATKP